MNSDDSKQLGERAKELLRAIKKLQEPFSTREIMAVAKIKSSVNHFLIQFVSVHYLKIVAKGKHNQPYMYERGDQFPEDTTIEPKKKTVVKSEPIYKRTPLEEAYWKMRNSFNIKPKDDGAAFD